VRLVQVTIPAGKRETVLRALDEEDVDYVVADETSGREFAAIAYVPLPTNAVEPILASLREAGLGEDAYTVVMEAETVVSRQFEALEERYAETEDEDRIAREELVAKAAGLAPTWSTYVVMTVVSAVIATAGLLLDSPAVVVGSMVIAPFIGPAMAASVGTVVDEQELFGRGIRLQVAGLVLAVAASTGFALAVRYLHLLPPLADVTSLAEVQERVAPDFLSLVVAVGAGVAGVVSLTSGVSTALVGVMIAVALIPPAATVGIGLAYGQPLVSLGSAVLLLVNVLSINLAALAVLWYKGYSPARWFRRDEAKSATLKRAVVLVLAIIVLSGFLGGVTYDSFQRAQTDERIDAALASALDDEATLLSVSVERTNTAVFQEPRRVVVTVGLAPGDDPPPELASRLDDRVDAAAGRDVTTEVRYVSVETA
jgi:uncharacterized hydrophobic protein (TIGR00341 family)